MGEEAMLEKERATVADAAEILALQKLAYLSEAKLYNDYAIPPLIQTIEELVADFGRKTFLKVVEGGRIVGSVNGFMKGGRCLIGRLMVHPDIQGRGIGTLLMKAIEAGFPDVRSWELFTGELSVKNIRLYERLGYRVVRKEPFPGNRYAVVFMAKTRNAGENGHE
jgi:GNAT superfamily N-acetyltransferase